MASQLYSSALEHSSPQELVTRCCNWPGCNGGGLHRAPKFPNQLSNYHWFCLGHAREYNKGWNYYAGMTDAEVEADVREDTVWRRPSWPLVGIKGGKGAFRFTPEEMLKRLGDFGPEWASDGGFRVPPGCDSKLGTKQAWAVAVFSLSGPVCVDSVKGRYKELVKQHHPDTNGGAKAAEEKIKEINVAYQIIIDMLAS